MEDMPILYDPELFQEHEEVIVFTRDELNRRIRSIIDEIEYVNKIYLNLDRSEEWKLIGIWPKIMQSVHHIDLNMDLIFKKEPLQSYLDTYIYDDVKDQEKSAAVSEAFKAFYFGQTKLIGKVRRK